MPILFKLKNYSVLWKSKLWPILNTNLNLIYFLKVKQKYYISIKYIKLNKIVLETVSVICNDPS